MILENTFRNKATATIDKRGGSILLFLRGSEPSPGSASYFPVAEPAAYSYVERLRAEGAPPTRAMMFLEARPFANAALGFEDIWY